jgi:hypothetical protein
MTVALASAADARYGKWLINLIGSVQRTSDLFDRMVVYDLGLTRFQRRLLENVRGVEVAEVPPFVPHWRQGRTWKTWIWTHLDADTIVWLDAGITVLKPLTDFLTQSDERGYFVVSQGVAAGLSTPTDYYDLYGLSPSFANEISIASGILAFRRDSAFYADVITPTFDDAALGRNLGFSAGEVAKLNHGLDALDEVIIRECPLFRYDQSLLTIHFYRSTTDPYVNDLYKYGGWRSPHDHPEQVIWSHRRSGDMRFLPQVRYRRMTALVAIPWGASVYGRRLARRYFWLLRPSAYAHVARRLLSTGRLRSPR